jgi:hypothetical protein
MREEDVVVDVAEGSDVGSFESGGLEGLIPGFARAAWGNEKTEDLHSTGIDWSLYREIEVLSGNM